MQNSAGPNLRAMDPMGGAKVMAAMPPIMAPMVEAMMQMPRALAASPLFIKGYPSNAVTAPPGVPGIFNMTEGKEFPISAPA